MSTVGVKGLVSTVRLTTVTCDKIWCHLTDLNSYLNRGIHDGCWISSVLKMTKLLTFACVEQILEKHRLLSAIQKPSDSIIIVAAIIESHIL